MRLQSLLSTVKCIPKLLYYGLQRHENNKMKWEKKWRRDNNTKKKCMNEPFESIGRAILTVTCNFCYSCAINVVSFAVAIMCPALILLSLWQWNNCYKYCYGHNNDDKKRKAKKKKKRMQFFFLQFGTQRLAYTWCIYVIWSCVRFLSLFWLQPHLLHAVDLPRRKYHPSLQWRKKLSLYYLRPLSMPQPLAYCNSSFWMQKWRSGLTNKTRKNTNVANLHQAAAKT